MRLIMLADTHGHNEILPQILKEEFRVLIHCGDLTSNGSVKSLKDFSETVRSSLTTTYGKQNMKENGDYKIVAIAGNHDICLQDNPRSAKILSDAGIIYLNNSGVRINGLLFWGIPWTPTFGYGWAFMADEDKLDEIWSKVPNNVDVLISHGPPRGILDLTNSMVHAGSRAHLKHVKRIRPRISVFGHIHEARGAIAHGKTDFANVSIMDAWYNPTNKPMTYNMEAE